jgi:hypothetical protein
MLRLLPNWEEIMSSHGLSLSLPCGLSCSEGLFLPFSDELIRENGEPRVDEAFDQVPVPTLSERESSVFADRDIGGAKSGIGGELDLGIEIPPT